MKSSQNEIGSQLKVVKESIVKLSDVMVEEFEVVREEFMNEVM